MVSEYVRRCFVLMFCNYRKTLQSKWIGNCSGKEMDQVRLNFVQSFTLPVFIPPFFCFSTCSRWNVMANQWFLFLGETDTNSTVTSTTRGHTKGCIRQRGCSLLEVTARKGENEFSRSGFK